MLALKRVDFVKMAEGRFSGTKLVEPERWLPALYNLMEGYQKQGAIRSLDALLMGLVGGDATAALMLKHVMEWQPHSIRADGAIWRSADEWAQQTGLSRSMVYNNKRRERLAAAGLKVWVERAWGENTLHFLIDAPKLTGNIARLLEMEYSVAKVKLWQVVPVAAQGEKPVIPFPKVGVSNGVPRVPNGKIPLTESSTVPSTEKTTLSVLFNSFSFSADEKAKYGVLAEDVVIGIFDRMAAKKAAGQLRKNPLAYLRGALNIALKAASPLTPHGEEDKAEEQAPVAAPKENPPLNPLPESDTPSSVVSGTVPKSAADVAIDLPSWWKVAFDQLEWQLTKDVWMYLRRLEMVDCAADTVTIFVPDGVPMWLVQRYQRNVERAISDTRMVKTKVVYVQGGIDGREA